MVRRRAVWVEMLTSDWTANWVIVFKVRIMKF
jgi:hypothetical protein